MAAITLDSEMTDMKNSPGPDAVFAAKLAEGVFEIRNAVPAVRMSFTRA